MTLHKAIDFEKNCFAGESLFPYKSSLLGIDCMKFSFFLIILVCRISFLNAVWDVEYWQFVNWTNWKSDPYKLYTTSELRFEEDCVSVYHYRITENFSYHALPKLNLEAHYSLIYNRSKNETRFLRRHRFEFEINPFYYFSNGISFRWRNRLELEKKQTVSHIEFFFRHRFLVVIPVDTGTKLTEIRAYNEVFYDFDNNKFSQNRFVPLELHFFFEKNNYVNAFIMIRNFFSFGQSKWYRSVVMGTELGF